MTSTESTDWRPRRVAIIGIGLLGGSLGLALRNRWPDLQVVGAARRAETVRTALGLGAATEAADSVAEACRSADLVVVGTPVTMIAQIVRQATEASPADCLITDVGSTKAAILHAVEQDPRAAEKFVGSHPIAGSEKSGPAHARADLFRDRYVVLTPTPRTDPVRLRRAATLWSACGAKLLSTTPEQHDAYLAATSHLPHLVAAALASIIPPDAFPFVGTGWRDTTRVAAGCPELWAAICQENAAAIADQLRVMGATIDQLRQAIESGDAPAIEELLRRGQEHRRRAESAP